MKKKYRLNGLNVEITRRCNKRCAHCVRGDAQDISMSEGIIDRIFDDVADVQRIILGNGEALLEIERIEYFVSKLIDSDWSTSLIEVTTNGTILDDRIVTIFESFCRSGSLRHAGIRISNDHFHDKDEYEKAWEFYKPLVDKANYQLLSEGVLGGIKLDYVLPPGNRISNLSYSGRAIDYVDNTDEFIHGKNVNYPHDYPHQIKVVDGTIPCLLTISSNGNATYDESISYQKMDELAIGNIGEQSLTEIIDLHNENCLVLCSETSILHTYRYAKHMSALNREEQLHIEAVGLICSKIVEMRYLAKELYSHVPAHVIIKSLPFLSSKALVAMQTEIYKHTPFYTPDMLSNIEKYRYTSRGRNYRAALLMVVVNYLKDKRIERKYPLWPFGNEDDIQEYLHFKFHDLNQQYKADPTSKPIGYPFACEILSNDEVDYREHPAEDVWSNHKKSIEDLRGALFAPEAIERLESLKSQIDINSLLESGQKEFRDAFAAVIHQEFEKFGPDIQACFTADELAVFLDAMIFKS